MVRPNHLFAIEWLGSLKDCTVLVLVAGLVEQSSWGQVLDIGVKHQVKIILVAAVMPGGQVQFNFLVNFFFRYIYCKLVYISILRCYLLIYIIG